MYHSSLLNLSLWSNLPPLVIDQHRSLYLMLLEGSDKDDRELSITLARK